MPQMRLATVPTAPILLTAIVAGLLAGCGSDDTAAKDSGQTSSATPSASPTEAEFSQDELQAKVIINAPPKDLAWMDPKAPSHWKRLQTKEGVAQWQIGDEPCTVILDQPGGVGSGKEPTSAQVVEREIGRIAASLKTPEKPKVVSDDPVMVANRVVGLDGTSSTKFAHARVDFGSGGEGDVRALRSGDFALIANAVCGQGRFADVFAAEIEPVLKRLSAKTSY